MNVHGLAPLPVPIANTTMQSKRFLPFALLTAVMTAAGCSDKQATAPQPETRTVEAPKPASAPAPAAPVAATPAAPAPSPAPAPAPAAALVPKANDAAASLTAKAQALIDQAQSLVGKSQFSDANKVLQQLAVANLNLTPDQQRLVSQLQPLVEKALASEAVHAQVQSLIDQAQKLVAGSKFEEASKILKQITGNTLTPDQQKMVSDLKSVVEKAIAAKATAEGVKAVGDLFKKKP